MNRLFRGLNGLPIIPVFPVYAVAPTFVSSSGMGMSSGPAASTPRTPPTMMQQLQNIFAQPITTGEEPIAPPALPRFSSPIEAARELQKVRRTQYQEMIKKIGGSSRDVKEAGQAELMRQERNIIQQLTGFGVPSRLIPQYK